MSRTAWGCALAVVALAGLPLAAHAQAQTESDGLRVTLYGWFPGIDGSTQFPSSAGGPSFNVNSKDVISNLKFAFMGTLEGNVGQWGGMVDWVYASLSGSRSGTRDFTLGARPLPGGVSANADLSIKQNILTLAGTYEFIRSPSYQMSVVAGARMLNLDQTFDWQFLGLGPAGIARTGTANVRVTNWDGIVGVKGRARLGSDLKWFVPYYFDVGTGQSQLTWQAIVGAGYSFSWGEVLVAWRYLDYDFDSDKRAQSLSYNGVAAGVSFRF
jgi:uncharacterized protein YaiE (UPF0345 family)